MLEVHRAVIVKCDRCFWPARWRFTSPDAAQRWIDGGALVAADMFDKSGFLPPPVGETFHVAGGKVFCACCTEDLIKATRRS